MSDWPPKLHVTPRGAASAFLAFRIKAGGPEDIDALAALLKEYWIGGFRSGYAYREVLPKEDLDAACEAMRRSDE